MAGHGWKWLEITGNCREWQEMDAYWKWMEIAVNGVKWIGLV